MRRLVTIIIFILTVTLGITACGKVYEEEKPKVNLTFNISNLTDDEFKEIGTNTLENATKDDLKKFSMG